MPLYDETRPGRIYSGSPGGATATPPSPPSSVVPIYGPGGVIIGYEVTFPSGDYDIWSPLEYDNMLKYGTKNPEDLAGGGGGGRTASQEALDVAQAEALRARI